MDWYYYDGNNIKQGPYNSKQLKSLAEHGIINPDTVIETSTGKIAKAREVKGFSFPEYNPNNMVVYQDDNYQDNDIYAEYNPTPNEQYTAINLPSIPSGYNTALLYNKSSPLLMGKKLHFIPYDFENDGRVNQKWVQLIPSGSISIFIYDYGIMICNNYNDPILQIPFGSIVEMRRIVESELTSSAIPILGGGFIGGALFGTAGAVVGAWAGSTQSQKVKDFSYLIIIFKVNGNDSCLIFKGGASSIDKLIAISTENAQTKSPPTEEEINKKIKMDEESAFAVAGCAGIFAILTIIGLFIWFVKNFIFGN